MKKTILFLTIASISSLGCASVALSKLGTAGAKVALPIGKAAAASITARTFGSSSDRNSEIDPQKYPNLRSFADVYRCPADLEERIAQPRRSDFVTDDKSIYLKDDISRVVNAIRSKEVIAQHNLDTIGVVNKWICYDRSKGRWATAAEAVVSHDGRHFNFADTKNLAKYVEETGYRDWMNMDIVNNHKNQKLTLFDTENGAYAIGMVHGVKGMNLPQHCKLTYALNFGQALSKYMDKESREWLDHRINTELKDTPEGSDPQIPLYANSKYDPKGMDLKKVKQEFELFQEASQRE